MFWLAILVVGGYAVFVLRPDERARVLAWIVRHVEVVADAARARGRRRQPDAFHEALAARARVPCLSAAIVLLDLVVFALLLSEAGPADDPAALLRWGGSIGTVTTNGQWWRLVTATFVHDSVVQLAVDVAALAQAAVLVERLFGRLTLAGIYVASAVLAGTIALWAEPLAVTGGASAPILAMYGLLVAMIVRGTLQRSPLTLPMPVVRRLAPAAGVFVAYYMAGGGVRWTSGLATFVIGFGIGLALTRDVAARTPGWRRVLPPAAATLSIAFAIMTPLEHMTDARSHVARLFAVEDHTAQRYRAATGQFTRGAIKADVLAQLIERSIVPELQAARHRLQTVTGVPRQQQSLVASADEFLRLRAESWTLRATALHKANMRLLREADEQERAAMQALERIRPAITTGALRSS